MTNPVRETITGLLDLVYPVKCLTCETFGESYLCPSCTKLISHVKRPFCIRCGHPQWGAECRNCSGRARSFSVARAAGEYSGVLRDAIHAFKYGGARMLADPLAGLLHEYLTERADMPWGRADCIVAVPIHPVRKRLRGYNQSELLAERLSHMTGLPLVRNAVVRIKSTRPQVELSGDERRANVRAAFLVRRPEVVRGKTILLVDDVATTCATIHECSAALLSGGAFKVYVICLAFGA